MAQTVTIVLSDDDIIDYSITREHWEPVEFLRTRGFTAGSSGNTPVFSKWPGSSPGFGNEDSSEDKLICDSVQDNYNRNGLRGARKNRIYVNSSGIWRKSPQLTLTLYGSYDVIDPANAEWIQFDVGAVANLRGTAVSDFRWLVRRVSVSYEGGTARTTLTLDAETGTDVAGVDDTPPPENNNGLPPYNPPGFDFPPIVTPVITPEQATQLYTGTQRIALICANGLALTTNFGSGSGTVWTFTTWATIGVSGTLKEWVPNGFSNPAAGWIVTSSNIYYLTLGAASVVDKHTFAATPTMVSADASFGFANRFCAVLYYDGVGSKNVYTTDNSTFSLVTITTNYVTSLGQSPQNGCFVSSRVDGRVYTTAHTNTAAWGSSQFEGKISSNGGATWGSLSSPNLDGFGMLGRCIHIPWHNNAAETIAYYADTSFENQRLFRADGTSQTDISPIITGAKYAPTLNRNSIGTYVGNRKRLLMVGQRNLTGASALFLTDNADVSSPTWTTLDGNGSNYRRCAISGDNGATFYLWGANATVDLSTDSGATRISQQGNLTSFTTGEITGLAGW